MSSLDDPVDLTHTGQPPCLSPAWRKRAVELAVERGLVGQAFLSTQDDRWALYSCVSARETNDYALDYFKDSDALACPCQAGVHERPCSHAGAVYLLIKGLAPERRRNAEGFTHGQP